MGNTEGSCIKRSPNNSDTLDLTMCEPYVTAGCMDGIQDLYYCQGASTTLSYPHFLLAEEQAEHFTGLKPESSTWGGSIRCRRSPRHGWARWTPSRCGEPAALISAATLLIFSIKSSPLASTMAALGLYLLRSRPCAGLQCSSGLRVRPSGAAAAIAQSAAMMRNLMML